MAVSQAVRSSAGERFCTDPAHVVNRLIAMPSKTNAAQSAEARRQRLSWDRRHLVGDDRAPFDNRSHRRKSLQLFLAPAFRLEPMHLAVDDGQLLRERAASHTMQKGGGL